MKAYVKPGNFITPILPPTYPKRIDSLFSLFAETVFPKGHVCKDVYVYLEDGKGEYIFHED